MWGTHQFFGRSRISETQFLARSARSKALTFGSTTLHVGRQQFLTRSCALDGTSFWLEVERRWASTLENSTSRVTNFWLKVAKVRASPTSSSKLHARGHKLLAQSSTSEREPTIDLQLHVRASPTFSSELRALEGINFWLKVAPPRNNNF